MRRLSYFLLIALAGLARADDATIAPVPVPPSSNVRLSMPIEYRCIDKRLYSDNCGVAIVSHAQRVKRKAEYLQIECVFEAHDKDRNLAKCAR